MQRMSVKPKERKPVSASLQVAAHSDMRTLVVVFNEICVGQQL